MNYLSTADCTKGHDHRPGKWEVLNASTQILRCVECSQVLRSLPMPSPDAPRFQTVGEAKFYGGGKCRQG